MVEEFLVIGELLAIGELCGRGVSAIGEFCDRESPCDWRVPGDRGKDKKLGSRQT